MLKVHMISSEEGKLPNQILIGGVDMNSWRVGVVLRGEADEKLTIDDRKEIAKILVKMLKERNSGRVNGLVLLPGTGLILSGEMRKGHG